MRSNRNRCLEVYFPAVAHEFQVRGKMSRESGFEMKKLTFLYKFAVASHLTDVVLNNILDFVEPNWHYGCN